MGKGFGKVKNSDKLSAAFELIVNVDDIPDVDDEVKTISQWRAYFMRNSPDVEIVNNSFPYVVAQNLHIQAQLCFVARKIRKGLVKGDAKLLKHIEANY